MMRKMPNFLSVIRRKIPRHFSQILATCAMSLGPFAAGLGKGYSSPALASLQESKTSTFHVTAQEGSWVASLSLLGALFGCLFGGLMLQLGRRRSLLIVALPFSGSWLLTVFAQRVEMMYSTSFIGGFFSAVTLLATQVYVSEIAHPEIRGCLSAVLKMAGELGTLSSFTLGAFLDWRQLATVAAGAPILFFFAILLIPETPSFLLYHGRDEEACKSMAWLRSSDEDVTSEIDTLRSNIITKYKSFFPRCTSQFPFRQLFITCGLMFFQKFSGVTVFHHYAVPIFKQVFGRSLDPHGAAIVVVLLRLLGSMTSGLLIDTAGRLPLLIISNLFISASFFGFGLYNWMEESLPLSYPGFGPSLDWIPLTCVLFFTLFFSIGIGPISWLMVGELFPLEYRGFGGAVSTSFSYACAFAAVKTYVDIRAHVGLYGAFWIYSGISIAGLFFVCCLVPETKGVELEEMEHHNNSSNLQNTSSLNPPSATISDNSASAAACPVMTPCAPKYAIHPQKMIGIPVKYSRTECSTTPPSENKYPPPMQTPPGAKQLMQSERKHHPHFLRLNLPTDTSTPAVNCQQPVNQNTEFKPMMMMMPSSYPLQQQEKFPPSTYEQHYFDFDTHHHPHHQQPQQRMYKVPPSQEGLSTELEFPYNMYSSAQPPMYFPQEPSRPPPVQYHYYAAPSQIEQGYSSNYLPQQHRRSVSIHSAPPYYETQGGYEEMRNNLEYEMNPPYRESFHYISRRGTADAELLPYSRLYRTNKGTVV